MHNWAVKLQCARVYQVCSCPSYQNERRDKDVEAYWRPCESRPSSTRGFEGPLSSLKAAQACIRGLGPQTTAGRAKRQKSKQQMWISGAWVKIEIRRGVYQGPGATPGGPELNLKATEVCTVSGAWANNGPGGPGAKG